MQILGAAGDIFLHQRHAESLGDAALDLSGGEKRVDHPSEIMRRGDADDLDRAKLQVDLDLGDLRAIAIDGIRRSLAILVERNRWRIEALFGAQHIAEFIGRHLGKLDTACGAAVGDDDRCAVEADGGLLAHIAEPQDVRPQPPP